MRASGARQRSRMAVMLKIKKRLVSLALPVLRATHMALFGSKNGERKLTPSRSSSASAVMSGLLSAANAPADAGTGSVKSVTESAAAPRMPKTGWISFSRYQIGEYQAVTEPVRVLPDLREERVRLRRVGRLKIHRKHLIDLDK